MRTEVTKVRKQDCGLVYSLCMLQLVGGGAQSLRSLTVGSSTTSRYILLSLCETLDHLFDYQFSCVSI